MRRYPAAFWIYVLVLTGILAAVLAGTILSGARLTRSLPEWLLLSSLFGLSEILSLHFRHERGRQSLGVGEAIVLTMLVVLSFSEMVWGITLGMAVVTIFYWRQSLAQSLYNVAQFGCIAAAAAGTWAAFSEPAPYLTVRNAIVAVSAVALYVILNQLLISVVIALVERRPMFASVKGVAPAVVWSLAGNITLGLLFAAGYEATPWLIFIFPLPLAALYLGYRAVLRQNQERERVEYLHAASRALAASNNFEDALIGFLRAMKQIVSSAEARAVLNVNNRWFLSAIRGNEVVQRMEPVEAGPLLELVEHFRANPDPLVLSEDTVKHQDVVRAVEASSLVGVALRNGDEFAGCLLAIDRVGAEEFSDSDARLLEALGNELVLTLDSYRLFAQVAEERERFQQIFDGSKEGICLLDEDGVIRAWNPALARITGFEEQDIIGEKWSERVLVRDRYHRRIEGMDIISVPPDEELELVTRQGPPRWVAIMSGEVPAEDKKSWVLLVRDITALHELEESKSDFLSTISHELRTPLTTIKGSLQVLSRPNASANSEIGKQMVEIMKRGSDRLERLVMNLLAVSQMESGDVQVYPDEVSLEELVHGRVASILPDHPQVEIDIEEKVTVRADRERLAQAVEHLLDNARKFGPESGRIRIEVTKHNGYARLSISDEGPGIPKIDQERIFERFVRLGHVLTRETQGPGVGLFIVKKSIEAMGGSVQVESEPAHGTTFHLRIPLAHPMAAVDTAS